MRRTELSAEDAVVILFGDEIYYDDDFDPGDPEISFASGADVCEALAAHFEFSNEDYTRIAKEIRRKRKNAST